MTATIKEESEIEAAVEIQKPILQAIDGNINHIASEAVKKVKAESLDKPGDSDEPKKGPGRPRKIKDIDSDDDESEEKIPGWAQKILAKNAELEQKIEKQVQEKTLASLAEKVSKHDKLKDIPQSFLKGRNLVPQSEAEIDQLVATIESDYNGFKQEMAEKGVIVSVPPAGGGAEGDGKVTIQDYLNEKFPKV